ncbi:unnamed protein product [Parajaminaea phylloscopi]
MDPLFSGSIAKQRQINLGGTLGAPSSSSQLAAQARSSRQLRDNVRRQELSALTVQRVWRGSRARLQVRESRRDTFRHALDAGAFTSLDDVQHRNLSVYASGTLAGILGRNFAERTARTSLPPADEELLTMWSQAMASAATTGTTSAPTSVLQYLLRDETSSFVSDATAIVRHLSVHLRCHASAIPLLSLKSYLRLFRLIMGSGWKAQSGRQIVLRSTLLQTGLYASLGSVLLSLPVTRKADPEVAESVTFLLLAPFNLNDPVTSPQSTSQNVSSFVADILSVPLLPNRLPMLAFAQLAARYPLIEVTAALAAQARVADWAAPPTSSPHTLANLLSMSSQRVSHLETGKHIANYLETLAYLQQCSSMESTWDAKAGVDLETSKRLAILPSAKHMGAILNASARFPAATRPALYRLICAILSRCDAETKAQVLNTVLYGSSGDHRGSTQGLVREVWRGDVRSSSLARCLASISATHLDSTLLHKQDEGWAPLIVLCELYSRLLLTLGDDEFFPPKSGSAGHPGGIPGQAAFADGSSPNAPSVAARNPLMIEEVLGLAGLVRNLAFALYWHLGPQLNSATDAAPAKQIPGVGFSFVQLRDVTTRLLQQIHARDARTRFTAEDFWLMTDEMDIDSFVQSVMLEEDKLAEEQGNEESDHAGSQDRFDDDDDAEHAGSALTRNIRPAKRHVSARKLAFISPRLGILNNLPFVIPFATRIQIFRAFIYKDAERLHLDRTGIRHRRTATVRRDHVAEDGMAQLNGLGSALKQRVEIIFIDQWGMQEAGIDGGGVFKEFLTSLIREAFDTDRGLWKATDQQELFPNPASYARQAEQLQWYAFLGRVLGKALYEGILVDVRFASFFLSKWLGRQQGMSHLDDLASLKSLDSELYRGLIYLKNYTGDVEVDLSLNFTVTDEEFGERKVTELVPNGTNIAVTNNNRLGYIFMVARYRLDVQIRAQSSAFFSGLSELIDPRWLRIFDQTELQRLIKGSEEPIDVADLRSNTVYSDYHEKDLAIEYFWQALESFDQPTRAALLKFVTSCPSPPLLGFSQLNPRFCIRLSSEDDQRLPTSSTCVNLLKLPRYTSLDQCREKLLTAIRSGAGFDLS